METAQTWAENVAEQRRMLETDWVVGASWTVLHHISPADDDFDPAYWVTFPDPIRATCGRLLKWACVPGVFTRIGAKRCDRCCDRMGYPRGKGSPRNDKAIQPLLWPDA